MRGTWDQDVTRGFGRHDDALLWGILPFLFQPLCLGMHFFMHGHGHGHRVKHGGTATPAETTSSQVGSVKLPSKGAQFW